MSRAPVVGIMQEARGSVPAVTGPANIGSSSTVLRSMRRPVANSPTGEILSDDDCREVDDVQKPIRTHRASALTESTLVVGAGQRQRDLDRRGAIATATHGS